MKKFLMVLAALAAVSLLLSAGPTRSLGAAADDEKLLAIFKQSDLLLTGTIEEAKLITTSNGVPPTYLMTVTFKDMKMLRGKEPAGRALSYQTPNENDPLLKVGTKVIAAQWTVTLPGGGGIKRSAIVEATGANLKLAAQAAASQPATRPTSATGPSATRAS